MNKLYRVLIFLVFFGLGIPCASAANVTSFVPQTVQMDMGASQEVQIVMDEVPYGISGFNITISVSDPKIAEITAVSLPGWTTIKKNSTSAVPSSSIWIKASDGDDEVVAGSKNVSLGNITITGKQAGTANLNISEGSFYDPDYSSIPFTDHFIPDAVPGNINILDTELPVINSVDLNNSTPNTGDSILVTVNTTDNVGVNSVKANNVLLIHQSGNTWNGSIIAVAGIHSVNVSSEDAAGNVAWNNSTSYTATTPELPDTELPVINSVNLNNSKPKTGDSILVTINATDNIGVSSVKANDISLIHQSGNIWNGSIVAIEGTHFVNVSAVDEAGNTAWNNTTSYKATGQDKVPPVINSVKLNNSTPNTDDSILVTVNSTDNVGVNSVKANDVSLVHQSGNIWNGSITAVAGTHFVNVSSADAAGNVAWNNSTSYIATTPELPDTELPVINSVNLNNSKPKTGDFILVTINATDNIGVSSVKANDISLIHQSGNIWNGSIVAIEGTHFVNVSSEDEAGNVAWNNDTSYTATTPEPPANSEGELQLWTFDASKVSDIPDNIYTANPVVPYTSNLSLAYNLTLRSVDSSCWNGDSGNTYITGAYPTVNENLTFTMGVDSSSQWSYGYIHTSVAYVGVRHASNNSYNIVSYWTSDDGSLLNSSFQIPASSVVNNRVTVSIHSYDSNRTNVVTAGPGLSVTTPYTKETTRKLPYTNVIQPLIYLECYASDASGWVNVHLYNITQSIPRDTITPYARNDIMAFGLDYPNVTNNKDGTDLLISRGQTASVYVSRTNLLNSTDVAYDNSLFANGFEGCIHFHPGLASESLEEAKTTIDSEIALMESTLGLTPASWSSTGNNDNVTHAIYAYSNYGSLYRNGPMGMAFVPNVNTLSNDTWAWWSVSSAHGAISPCFTHQTDNSPAIQYSIDPDLFENFVTNLNSNGIDLVGFSKWYYSSMAQTATTNVLQSDENNLKFELNTSGGYPINMNVQTTISPLSLDCNGVSVPFDQTSDGIQFMSIGNGTYTLTNSVPVLPVANFTANTTEGTAPLTVKFTDASTNNPTAWAWEFGDGQTSDVQDPEHTYVSEGIYQVNLTVSNDDGSSGVKSLNITVTQKPEPVLPVANFTANTTEGTAPLTVKFTDASTNNPTSWSWEFGDGTTSNEQDPEHTYVNEGVYQVNLTASNDDGSSDVKSLDITVTQKPEPVLPVANFTANTTEGTAPLTVKFTDASTNNPTSWSWEFGDGQTSDVQDPEHTYVSEGIYQVNLTVSNDDGSSGVKSLNITVIQKPEPVLPVANFTANLTVHFTDTSTNNPTQWEWNFGDGTTSTEQNPVHVYDREGTYTVTLVATNDAGSSYVRSMVITVTRLLTVPVVNFTANITEGYAPLTVQFTDTSTNSPTQWNWDFGDGTTSNEKNPVHVFSGEGTYSVTLVAINSEGSSNPKSMNIKVNHVPTLPVANFSTNVSEGSSPLTVQFTDTSTNNPTQWNWDFGDGTTSTKQHPVHVFNGEGTYSVTLVAINGDGHSDPKSMNIKVNRVPTPPVVNFTAKQTEPLKVQFNDTSSNSPTQWNWEFGDGSTSTDANPAHAYAAAGTYTVNLTVSNADGSDTASKTITVTGTSASPIASFTLAPQIGRAPLTVKFTDKSVNATSIKWDFGDGTTSTESNPSHTYTTGFYIVKLTATNGNKSSTAANIIIVGR